MMFSSRHVVPLFIVQAKKPGNEASYMLDVIATFKLVVARYTINVVG